MRVKLVCGHGRTIKKGSMEEADAREFGWAFCNVCKTTESIQLKATK